MQARPQSLPDKNLFNTRVAGNWINAHSSDQCKRAVTSLIKVIQRIPHEEFEQNFIDKTLKHLNEFLSKDEFEYVAPVESGKSNQWMYELARPHLTKQPKEIATLVFIDFLKSRSPERIADLPANFVFFDDAIMSGEQMSRNIRNIYTIIVTENVKLKSNGKPEIPIPTFIVACAYITEFGKDMLNKMPKQLNMKSNIIILNHSTIPTVDTAIEDENIKETLKNMYWSKKSMTEKPMIENDSGPESRGVVYFAHKVPDKFAFPEGIATGFIFDSQGKKIGGNYSLIPPTKPPYKE
jgi:hypothetical protein